MDSVNILIQRNFLQQRKINYERKRVSRFPRVFHEIECHSYMNDVAVDVIKNVLDANKYNRPTPSTTELTNQNASCQSPERNLSQIPLDHGHIFIRH